MNGKGIWLCLGSLLLLCLSGCAGEAEEPAGTESWVLTAEPEYVEQWPENDLTALIPQPREGTVDYVRDYLDYGRFEIVWKDISREGASDYLADLEAAGYREAAAAEEDASLGILLEKDGVTLSLSASGTIMALLITTADAGA